MQFEECKKQIVTNRAKAAEYEKELKQVRREMSEKESLLGETEAEHVRTKSKWQRLELERAAKEKALAGLFEGTAGGRGKRFRSEEEREEWVMARCEELVEGKREQEAKLMEVEVSVLYY